ncbi:MAG: matrixin family metalloprotease [Acidimicrobiales bacterium]
MDRYRNGRRWLRLAVAFVLAAGVSCGGSSGGGPLDGIDLVSPAPDSADCPVRNHLAAEFNGRTRTGLETPVDYAFLEARQGGCQPVRFNPCEPIHYVVNAALAPPGALDDLHAAMRMLEEASGLRFVDDGPTDERFEVSRPRSQPERYGARWAPVLVVWDHGERHRMDASNPAGGLSSPVDGVSVTGVLIVNVDTLVDSRVPPSGFGEGGTWGRVFLHELGHIVGLGHVARSDQLMFPELGVQGGRAEYHAGDLAGLRLLGREAGCLPTPAPPAAARP